MGWWTVSDHHFVIQSPAGFYAGNDADGQPTWVELPADALVFATSNWAGNTARSLPGFDETTWHIGDVVGLGLRIEPLNHALKATARKVEEDV